MTGTLALVQGVSSAESVLKTARTPVDQPLGSKPFAHEDLKDLGWTSRISLGLRAPLLDLRNWRWGIWQSPDVRRAPNSEESSRGHC